MKAIIMSVKSDGDFTYESEFDTLILKDTDSERVVLDSIMKNLKRIAETITSTKHDISYIKYNLLDFVNRYYSEHTSYYQIHIECYFNKANNVIEFGIDYGNWNIKLNIVDEVSIENTDNGLLIKGINLAY